MILLSFDQDWAPAFMMDPIIDDLIRLNLKSTWFVTNDNSSVQRMLDRPDLFEVGIHPNFLPGSTQGEYETDIVYSLLDVVPDAKVVRTHHAYQHHGLLKGLSGVGIEVDSSLYLGGCRCIEPFDVWYSDNNKLTRIPYYWCEESELHKPNPFALSDWITAGYGLKVLAFHPVHVYLNSCTMRCYQMLKRVGFPDVTEEQCSALINPDFGAKRFYEYAIQIAKSKTLLEVAKSRVL